MFTHSFLGTNDVARARKFYDAAMGALTGISFTLVYATVALPMARLADRGVRRNVVAAALAFWSAPSGPTLKSMEFCAVPALASAAMVQVFMASIFMLVTWMP